MHRTNIYENVLIGTFIYSVGLQAGASGAGGNQAAIGLFQQTPADPYIGDMFANFGGLSLIIEFKAENSDSEQEKINDLIASLQKSENLNNISKSCHFLAVGTQADGNPLLFWPYVDQSDAQQKDTNTYITNLLNNGLGVSSDSFKMYMTHLASLNKSDRSFGTAGLVVNLSEDGRLCFVPSPTMDHLLNWIDGSPDEPQQSHYPTPRG